MGISSGTHGRAWGYSLVELLVCVVIIAILTGISLVCYQGSVDASDFRYAMPQIAKNLDGLQQVANEQNAVVKAEFVANTATVRLSVTVKGKTEESVMDLSANQLLHRPLVFRGYEWPDGTKSPRTFTYYPNAQAQGGIVYFGTGFAAGKIRLRGGRVDWDI